MPFWAITKHADIVTIGKQPEKFLNGPRLVLSHEPETPNIFPPTLIQLDPPKHGVYRQLISKRFTPRYLQSIHGDIERIGKQIVDQLLQKSGPGEYGECDFVKEVPAALRRMHADIERIGKEIVDGLLEAGDSGQCDFVQKVSAPLPIAVIAWMLGVPRADWDLLFDWTNRTIGAGDPEYQQPGKTPQESAMAAMTELFGYFAKLVEEKRKKPGDDLVSLFAHLEVDGQRIPEMDVLTFCLIIVIAGNETTRNGTTGGMLAFIEHPEEMRKLVRNPKLIDSAVEEVVRWVSPLIHFGRTATVDFELRGKKIEAGQALALFYPSANRDEEIFPDGDVFRVDRNPNHHLGFGVGEHFCLGSHVARLELAIAYKYLLPRIEEIEIAGDVERLASALVGGVKRLPIRYKLTAA
jgi:cytochrome P450